MNNSITQKVENIIYQEHHYGDGIKNMMEQ